MAYQTSLVGALHDAGLDVVEYPGWQTRGNATFTPRGVVAHHTGPWSTVQAMVQMCIHGRPDLTGPLCHVVLDPDGVCHLIAAGRANHAGAGGWRGLTGNSSVFGIEAVHNGDVRTVWPVRQLDAYVRCAAAMCRSAGVSADFVSAHREWAPRRKIDPVGIDMALFRDAVAIQLAGMAKEVAPMFDPALQIAAWCLVDYDGGDATAGLVAVAPDGAVYCEPPALYRGGPFEKPYWGDRRAARIVPNDRGGYDITATNGDGPYSYPET